MKNFGIYQTGSGSIDNVGPIAVGQNASAVVHSGNSGTHPTHQLPPRLGPNIDHRGQTHYTIVALDVAGSGSRNDRLQRRMRADLKEILDEVLVRQFGSTDVVHRDDLGDGTRIIAGPEIAPKLLVDPFVPYLTTALREHRMLTSEIARLRLRMAIHMGLLERDEQGWMGHPLVRCVRLLDAQPTRLALAETPSADLVVVVSHAVFESVVDQRHSLDPDMFQPVVIEEKETRTTAWIHLPGLLPRR